MVQLRQVLLTALITGVVAGGLWAAVHQARLAPLIAAAERYEAGAGHGAETLAVGGVAVPRGLLLVAGNVISGLGFALLLVAGYTVHGGPIGARRGLLWGLAGYAAFMLAPALGVPPLPPGLAVAGDLAARQLWWAGTVLATAAGLGLAVFAAPPWLKALGVALLVLPHAVGAPEAATVQSALPPDLAARFTATVLGLSAGFWAVLGVVSGWLFDRLAAEPGTPPPHD